MKRNIGLAVAALLIAVSAGGLALTAQSDNNDDDDDGANLGDAPALQVRVGAFFSGYGLESGEPIAGAGIAVMAEGDQNETVLFEGVTDQHGRLALPTEPGHYRITAEVVTSDPMCWWYGEARDVGIGRDTAVVITIDAGLMCA